MKDKCKCNNDKNKCSCGCGGKKGKCTCTPENNCGCLDENGKCTCTPEDNCGCLDEKGKCTCTPENNCGCLDENGKCTCTPENNCTSMKNESNELENKIAELEKTNADLAAKANSYLQTASYYKNESESQKKDFERYKERNKNIEKDAILKANENIAKKLLPILDNFDQAIAHVDSEIMKGFSMIYASMINCLTDLGVVEIESEGELNPELHNCINTEATDDDSLDGVIATIYQKGYKFVDSDKVVRPATVSVYKKQ